MKRREFIAGLGSAAVWPFAAGTQQRDRMRRIGVLRSRDETDPVPAGTTGPISGANALPTRPPGRRLSSLRSLKRLRPWVGPMAAACGSTFVGGGGDSNRIRALARELVGLPPDIIVTSSTPVTAGLQGETRTIPIVFANVSDPVVSGIVAALNQPCGNITGFATLEASIVGKWLELLSEIEPGLKRAAATFNPDTAPVSVYMPLFETATRSLRIGPIAAPVHDD